MKPVSLEVTMMKIIGELKAENERLKAEYTHKDGLWTQLLSENHRIREAARIEVASLKAEVERLTEAGNNLWAFAHNCVGLGVYPKTAQEKIDIWNAAKEGKTK